MATFSNGHRGFCKKFPTNLSKTGRCEEDNDEARMINDEKNAEARMTKGRATPPLLVRIWSFGLPSCFIIRVSSFLRECICHRNSESRDFFCSCLRFAEMTILDSA